MLNFYSPLFVSIPIQIIIFLLLYLSTIYKFIQKYFLASRHVLKKAKKYWPQLDMDGILNIWILKPGYKSRGRGIVLMNKLEDVLVKVNPANKTDIRFVVQKYIGEIIKNSNL